MNMKVVKIGLGLVALLMFASSCNRVKCPSDTFSKADIEAQNQQQEAEL